MHTLKARQVPVNSLRAHPRNYRRHPEKQLRHLARSIRENGFYRNLVVASDGVTILAGHGAWEAARLEGLRKVPAVCVDFGPNDPRALKLLAEDNAVQRLAEDDEAVLVHLLAEVTGANVDLLGTGYTDAEIQRLLAELPDPPAPPPDAPSTGALAAPPRREEELPVPPVEEVRVRPGQLYALGKHRLLCGDSLTSDLNQALAGLKVQAVVEDPPYAIYGSSTGVSSDIADWEMVLPFFEATLRRAYELLPLFGHAYIFCDWRSFAPWVIASKRVKMALRNKLVWDKGSKGMGTNWGNTYEEIAYFAKLPLESAMQSQTRGVRKVLNSNILRYPRPAGDEREHNSAKPVALLRELVTASTGKDGVVLDMFCGSGSTLIACEAEGRVCVTADKEPRWVQVTINRWERYTGQQARLLEDAGTTTPTLPAAHPATSA